MSRAFSNYTNDSFSFNKNRLNPGNYINNKKSKTIYLNSRNNNIDNRNNRNNGITIYLKGKNNGLMKSSGDIETKSYEQRKNIANGYSLICRNALPAPQPTTKPNCTTCNNGYSLTCKNEEEPSSPPPPVNCENCDYYCNSNYDRFINLKNLRIRDIIPSESSIDDSRDTNYCNEIREEQENNREICESLNEEKDYTRIWSSYIGYYNYKQKRRMNCSVKK